jgi:hypothetical protein
MTIVSIRGTHGSGKSTIVKKIIDKYAGRPLNPNARGACAGYYATLPNGETVYIVGSYHNACGGCDGIQPYSDIIQLMEAAERLYQPHILLEGALVSSSYGSIGHWMNERDGVFAFLDTPLEVCLERIKTRRAAKGNFEPLNPKNTTVKHENVHRTKDQMARLGSRVRIVDIDHREPVKQIMRLFGVNLRKEP